MTTASHTQSHLPQAAGFRRYIQTIGVDSGTMAIGGDRFPDRGSWDRYLDCMMESSLDGVFEGAIFSSTGWGDGGYEVLAVESTGGALVGVEVVFICRPAEAACLQAIEKAGITIDNAVIDRACRGEASKGDEGAYREYSEQTRVVGGPAWAAALADAHPACTATPVVRGRIQVRGYLEIGDPCYGGPSCEVEVPAGEYVAVTWMDSDDPDRVARLGAYLTGAA